MLQPKVLVSALAALLACAASAQTYSLTDLGSLPSHPYGLGEWINDLGEVTGTLSTTEDGTVQRAFVYRRGALTLLPSLSSASTYTYGHAINDAGVVVGEGDTGQFWPQALQFRDGKIVNIDPNNGANARAIFVANNGGIVGNMTKSGSGNVSSWKVLVWTEDAKKPGRFNSVALPAYPGGDPKSSYTYAYGANQKLQVVGVVQSSLFAPLGFGQCGAFWKDDAAHTLALLRPAAYDTSAYASAVNDLGVAVGVSSGSRPVVWAADAGHTVSVLPALSGDVGGSPKSINNLGQIVGLSYGPGWVAHPVLWQNGTAVDLQASLDTSGTGYTLLDAAHVNNLGQIVGTATIGGKSHAVILTPAAAKP